MDNVSVMYILFYNRLNTRLWDRVQPYRWCWIYYILFLTSQRTTRRSGERAGVVQNRKQRNPKNTVRNGAARTRAESTRTATRRSPCSTITSRSLIVSIVASMRKPRLRLGSLSLDTYTKHYGETPPMKIDRFAYSTVLVLCYILFAQHDFVCI